MQTVEMYFNDTIEKYSLFRRAAVSLIQEISSLSPEVVYNRCEDLTAMHHELTENKEQFFIIMEFMGPGILDTSHIGEFQRALDKSILACDSLYAKILVYKNELTSRSQ